MQIKGYIYLIIQTDSDGNELFKIGISKNEPLKRLKQLKTGNPNVIDILKTYQSYNYKKIEKMLHKRFLNKKTLSDNEWFKLDDKDVLNFENICKETDELISFLLENNPFYK